MSAASFILSGKRLASMGNNVDLSRELNHSNISGTSFTFMSVVAAWACLAFCQPPISSARFSHNAITRSHSSFGIKGIWRRRLSRFLRLPAYSRWILDLVRPADDPLVELHVIGPFGTGPPMVG